MVNRDDVIRMAREADPGFGNKEDDLPDVIYGIPAIERFAHLIASHVAEECANECDKRKYYGEAGPILCASAIRSLYKPTA